MDVVFFDIDDTLYNQAQPFGWAVRTVLGAVPASDDELFNASRRHSGEVFAAFAAGGHPSQAVYARRMQTTLAEFGIQVSDETARRIQHVYATQSGTAMSLSPGMRQVLEECHRRSRVGVISNGRTAQQLDKLRILGIDRWVAQDAVFISEALGIAKPSPEIFEYACRQLHTTPERCLYVGDSLSNDVPGAIAAGMPVVWFHHRDIGGSQTVQGTRGDKSTAAESVELATSSQDNPAPKDAAATDPQLAIKSQHDFVKPTWTVANENELLTLLQRILV